MLRLVAFSCLTAVVLAGANGVSAQIKAPCTASLSLKGNGAYVRAASATVLQNPTSTTYEAWVRPRILPNNRNFAILSKSDGQNWNTNRAFDMKINGYGTTKRVYAEFFMAVGTKRWYSGYLWGPVVTAGKWMHVAATFDSKAREAIFYVDGVQVARKQTPVGATIYQCTLPLCIGATWRSSWFDGEIGMARVWNVALSHGQVQAFARIESAPLPGVTASWTFDGHLFDRMGKHHCAPVGSIGYLGGCGSWTSYGTVAAGPYGVPAWTLNRPPTLGSSIAFSTDNGSGSATTGLFLLGVRPRSVPLLNGTLLVDHQAAMYLSIPSTGGTWSFKVPNDQQLFGYPLFSQLLVRYPRQTNLGFSRGLQLMVGNR